MPVTVLPFRRHALVRAAATLLASLSVPALAQSLPPEPPAAADASEAVELDKVTVTATRRDEGVQEVPLNITAVTRETIERDGLTDLAELVRTVPGLFVVDQGGRDASRLVVRGLNVSSIAAAEANGNGNGGTVATYVGDIPLYLDLKLLDIERVEALLGPQGTLYGAGTLGGALRYLPQRPQTRSRSLEVSQDLYALSHSGGLGSETQLVGNLPLSGQTAVRAAIGYFDHPGFIDQDRLVREPGVSTPDPLLATPPLDPASQLRRKDDVDTEQTLAARLSLLHRLGDLATFNLAYLHQNQDVGGRTINHQDALGVGQTTNALRYEEPNERRNQLLSLEADVYLGFATLTSATGYSEYTELGQRDQTDLLLDLSEGGGYGYEDFPAFSSFTRETGDQERLNQELRLVSTGPGPWNWIAGLFYNRAESFFTSEEFVPGLPGFFGVERPDNLEYFSVADQTFTETAVFGELGYQLTEAWTVTVGGRFFRYEDDLRQAIAFPLLDTLLGDAPDAINLAFESFTVSDNDSLFKLNTSYRFSPDLLAYFTLSEGYRSGGVNALPLCPENPGEGQTACVTPEEALIKPDRTLNHELGIRSSWYGGRLVLNGSVYYIAWDDVQVAGVTDLGSVPITVNGAEARSTGFDLAAQAQLSERWDLAMNYAFNEAALSKDSPGVVDNEIARKGDRLPASPEQLLNLRLGYQRPLDNGWTLRADYSVRATGDVYTRVGLRDNGEALPAYTLHFLSAGLSRGPLAVRLYADNLFDAYAETGVRGDRGPASSRLIPGDADGDGTDDHAFQLRRYYKDVIEPLRVGLSLRYQFGG
ncbi:MAG TPA: TonB-dependent receptor [Nevskiaceae bacterium]|nr:TonB-dependent receptor [Nevskiaceae bacterium]